MRIRSGILDYRDSDGRSRGREYFHLHVDDAGLRTLAATCEIDATRLVRQVVQTADARFRPQEAYVRVVKGGTDVQSGWLRFSDTEVRVDTRHERAGERSDRRPLERPARAFGSHPLSVDGWMAALFDLGGPPVQRLRDAWVSSREIDGSGTVDCLPVDFALEYLGIQNVVTPAGAFECNHFRYLLEGSGIDHPPYETWVATDGDCLLVRARIGAPLHYEYELVLLT